MCGEASFYVYKGCNVENLITVMQNAEYEPARDYIECL
ncbi:hypothetical protein V518_0189 [Thermoanaerobacterium aotearoense SCUT27]|uniref:Uncharacterized protein n=2 Tax=Thermoanaerobacterium TaxID=28895 RepID=W9EF39_9THEO|nr:hypothetical protein Tsac_0178 [Thermoanaerobacterium saccharolyticum JW/SL-YS485]ETO39610.1 hypothetical protein V518_0189 [Thermoanaerobacterium aotearoense SCUT27]